MWITPTPAPGEFEAAALRRERDELWRNRNHLTPAQGKQLDILIGRIGHPEEPKNQVNNFSQFVNPHAIQGQFKEKA